MNHHITHALAPPFPPVQVKLLNINHSTTHDWTHIARTSTIYYLTEIKGAYLAKKCCFSLHSNTKTDSFSARSLQGLFESEIHVKTGANPTRESCLGAYLTFTLHVNIRMILIC